MEPFTGGVETVWIKALSIWVTVDGCVNRGPFTGNVQAVWIKAFSIWVIVDGSVNRGPFTGNIETAWIKALSIQVIVEWMEQIVLQQVGPLTWNIETVWMKAMSIQVILSRWNSYLFLQQVGPFTGNVETVWIRALSVHMIVDGTDICSYIRFLFVDIWSGRDSQWILKEAMSLASSWLCLSFSQLLLHCWVNCDANVHIVAAHEACCVDLMAQLI